MEWHVILENAVSVAIGGFQLPHRVLIGLLNWIHNELGLRYEHDHRRRDPEDQDCYCIPMRFAAEDSWHLFKIVVNDTRAANHLFVESIAYQRRPFI